MLQEIIYKKQKLISKIFKTKIGGTCDIAVFVNEFLVMKNDIKPKVVSFYVSKNGDIDEVFMEKNIVKTAISTLQLLGYKPSMDITPRHSHTNDDKYFLVQYIIK